MQWSEEKVARQAGIPVVLESSVKKALEVEWADGNEKATALASDLLRLRLPEPHEGGISNRSELWAKSAVGRARVSRGRRQLPRRTSFCAKTEPFLPRSFAA